MRSTTYTETGRLFGLGLLVLLTAMTPALAEGDAPFFSENRQDFDNHYARYKGNGGYTTNFTNELLPLGTFNDDGGIKFEGRDVRRPGKGANAFERGGTGFQIDFNF